MLFYPVQEKQLHNKQHFGLLISLGKTCNGWENSIVYSCLGICVFFLFLIMCISLLALN